MRNILKHSVFACLLVICAAYCRAELTGHTHDFNEMLKGTPTLTFTGTTYGAASIPPVLAYQGAGGGAFAVESSLYVFKLASKGSTLETLSAVEDLTRFEIMRNSTTDTSLKFYISSDDGENWTEVSEGIIPRGNSMEVPMPAKGNYRIKIERTSKAPINIQAVVYYTDPCNCLRVVNE